MQPNPTLNTPKSGLPEKSGAAAGVVVVVSAVVLALVAFLVRPPKSEWTELFDGSSLAGWKITEFGGEGETSVENGALVLAIGNDMTGVSRATGVPKTNYEVELEAMRVDGSDFFCGLTVPVQSNCCTLIVGGWGGSLTGLSSIDHMDASENQTSGTMTFEQNRWYKIRLRVTPDRIEAWIDNKSIFAVETAEKTISMRAGDIEDCMPLGLATYETTAHVRNLVVRRLP